MSRRRGRPPTSPEIRAKGTVTRFWKWVNNASYMTCGRKMPSAALCLRIIEWTGGALSLRDLVQRIQPAEAA